MLGESRITNLHPTLNQVEIPENLQVQNLLLWKLSGFGYEFTFFLLPLLFVFSFLISRVVVIHIIQNWNSGVFPTINSFHGNDEEF